MLGAGYSVQGKLVVKALRSRLLYGLTWLAAVRAAVYYGLSYFSSEQVKKPQCDFDRIGNPDKGYLF